MAVAPQLISGCFEVKGERVKPLWLFVLLPWGYPKSYQVFLPGPPLWGSLDFPCLGGSCLNGYKEYTNIMYFGISGSMYPESACIFIINGQVYLVRHSVCKGITSVCFFINKWKSIKLSFARWTNGKRILENRLGFHFCFPFDFFNSMSPCPSLHIHTCLAFLITSRRNWSIYPS